MPDDDDTRDRLYESVLDELREIVLDIDDLLAAHPGPGTSG